MRNHLKALAFSQGTRPSLQSCDRLPESVGKSLMRRLFCPGTRPSLQSSVAMDLSQPSVAMMRASETRCWRWTCRSPASAPVPLALLFPVACGVFGVGLSVATPILRVALTPAFLGRRLIGPVVRILLELLPLPTPAPFTLTRRLRTKRLIRDIPARRKQVFTRGTSFSAHGAPPAETMLCLKVVSSTARWQFDREYCGRTPCGQPVDFAVPANVWKTRGMLVCSHTTGFPH